MEKNQAEVVQEPSQKPVQIRERKGTQIKVQFDWSLDSFDEQGACKNLSKLAEENLSTAQQKNNTRLYIADSTIKSMTINKQHIYILRGESQQTGKIQITRKYSDIHALRQALVRRWPGCFIPPIPQKGNIGVTQKHIFKNKIHLVSSFFNRLAQIQSIFCGQQFQVFLKSMQNEVQKNLTALKQHSLQDQYGLYKTAWPEDFKQTSQIDIDRMQQRIKKFEDYFGEKKKDLATQKDSIKRLAQLRTKLTAQHYLVLQKILPQYQHLCLNWFNGKTNEVEKEQSKQEGEQKKQEDQAIEQNQQSQDKIYSHPKYIGTLQAYKEQLFPKDEGDNDDWLIYEMFKFELLQIESFIQSITTYKYLLNEKRYYQRNIEGNKQQLQDIINKKMSFKILLLSGSEDEKKTQLANQTQFLQNKYKICEQLWNALTIHVHNQLQKFQHYRSEYYKQSLRKAFKKQTVYTAKLFKLYSEIYKL